MARRASDTRSRWSPTGVVPRRPVGPGATNQYVFAYTITHHQHRRRRRRSSSAGTGSSPTPSTRSRKCKGLGVVGQQPLLKPGESFEYTSGASHPDARWARCAAPTRWWPRTGTRSTRRSRRSRCRCRACCIERPVSSRSASPAVRAAASCASAPIVHHTMPTAMQQRDQRFEQEPAHRPRVPSSARRARRRRRGCCSSRRCARAALPDAARRRRRRRRPSPRAARRRRPSLPRDVRAGRVERAARLGRRSRSPRRGPRSASAAARSLADADDAAAVAGAVRRRARRRRRDARRGARVLRAHFSPYRVARRRRPRHGPRHRLLRAAARGSRTRTARFARAAVRARPTTC